MSTLRHARSLFVTLLFLAALCETGLAFRSTRLVGVQPDGTVVIPTGQTLRPAGTHLEVNDRPLGMVVSPNGQLLAAVTGSNFAPRALHIIDVSTNTLNRWFGDATSANPPPAVSGRRLKLNYITQTKARPPSFVIFCTRADAVPDSYLRYLVNNLREAFDLPGTPIRLTLREKSNPFAGRAKKKR